LATATSGLSLVRAGKPVVLNALALDCSGSMQAHGDAPREAVNENMVVLGAVPHADHMVCMVGFASTPRVLMPIRSCKDAVLETYNAGGSTALYLTVGDLLEHCLHVLEQVPAHMLDRFMIQVGVFSDGMNWPNAAETPAQHARVRRLAARALESSNIDLLTFGIGISGERLAELLGFPVDDQHVQTVAATRAGIRDAADVHTTRSSIHFSRADLDVEHRRRAAATPTPPPSS